MAKQFHKSFQSLDKLASESPQKILDTLNEWSTRGIRLDPESVNQTPIFDGIDFSSEQLGVLKKSMLAGATYWKEQQRAEDADTYRKLANYFSGRE